MQAKRQKSRPNTREQLQLCIKKEMRRNGHNCDLNHIDVSRIDNMDRLFFNSPFNGDISRWDVGHVVWMNEMFQESQFNGDLSQWNVSRVVGMRQMFAKSNFNGDVASWDVSSCRNFNKMFYGATFLGDVSSWTMGVDPTFCPCSAPNNWRFTSTHRFFIGASRTLATCRCRPNCRIFTPNMLRLSKDSGAMFTTGLASCRACGSKIGHSRRLSRSLFRTSNAQRDTHATMVEPCQCQEHPCVPRRAKNCKPSLSKR